MQILQRTRKNNKAFEIAVFKSNHLKSNDNRNYSKNQQIKDVYLIIFNNFEYYLYWAILQAQSEMKLWILSTIWNRITTYIENLTACPRKQENPALPPQPSFQKIKDSSKTSTRKTRKLYKFNSHDASDISYIKSMSRYLKNKKILKISSSDERKSNRSSAPIIVNREVKLIQNIFGDSENDISAILEKSADDSQQTVKQFLLTLDPSCQTQINRFKKTRQNYKKRQNRERKLRNQILGHLNKGRKSFSSKLSSSRNKIKRNGAAPIIEVSREQSIENFYQNNKQLAK